MSWSYAPSTDVGRMRRTLPDRVEVGALFTDEELVSFLADEGDWRRGTALALETIASDTAMILTLKSGDDSVSGGTSANSLLDRAARLREQAERVDGVTGGLFDSVDFVITDFQARERFNNEILRELA